MGRWIAPDAEPQIADAEDALLALRGFGMTAAAADQPWLGALALAAARPGSSARRLEDALAFLDGRGFRQAAERHIERSRAASAKFTTTTPRRRT